jgi:type IV pilus assembly protein PilM
VFLRSKSRALVGIDINAEEIRLLQLRNTRQSFEVEKYAVAPLPAGAVSQGKIRQMEMVQTALNKLVLETGTAKCPAAIALPVNMVITKRVPAPLADDITHYFPGIQDTLCFDYVADEKELLLVASRSELLNQYKCLLEEAQLKLKIVDVDTFALTRAASLNPPVNGILDIAPEVTQIIILHERQIIFRQHWQTGNDELLLSELNRALQLCQASHQSLRIDSMLMSGRILSENVAKNFDIKFIPAHPLTDLPQAERWMTCTGLAMREIPLW